MRAVPLLQLAILCGLAGCQWQPKPDAIVLSYCERNTFCIGCPSFSVDLSEGGHVRYKCFSDCAVPGEQEHIVAEQQFRDMVEAFHAANFFSIPRTDPKGVVWDVLVVRLTYRDQQRAHEVVDMDRGIPRLTELESRMKSATDVERYLKPSVALYRRPSPPQQLIAREEPLSKAQQKVGLTDQLSQEIRG